MLHLWNLADVMPTPKSGQDEELDIQVSVPNNLDSTSVSIHLTCRPVNPLSDMSCGIWAYFVCKYTK